MRVVRARLTQAYLSLNIITTVGLGDIAPQTGGGRLVVTLEQVAAVTIIPLELAALSKALLQEASLLERLDSGPITAAVRPRREGLQCRRCGLGDHEADAVFCRRCGEALLSA